ncbi:hypothetical protein MTBBW1_350013 [Desulfamplus magnetovallimortis]|uniref:Uncharacterized protein n=1 Tax=Desulfamplus magnetovallimortis TaxID=1246637 RepID=A0A1W1HGL3_9BACT|nr:hypothetical protein MTBBW1_350013 [Desulfamplus magnetovallimortis]
MRLTEAGIKPIIHKRTQGTGEHLLQLSRLYLLYLLLISYVCTEG